MQADPFVQPVTVQPLCSGIVLRISMKCMLLEREVGLNKVGLNKVCSQAIMVDESLHRERPFVRSIVQPLCGWMNLNIMHALSRLPGRSSPCCILCTSLVASGRRRMPFTFRRPVPKQTPQTRTPLPKHWGHSTNSYVSLARFLFKALHLPVPPHISHGVAPVPAHSIHLLSAPSAPESASMLRSLT